MTEPTTRERYDALLTRVLRLGGYLGSPRARMLAEPEWERLFSEYQEMLAELRRLGDELRPAPFRSVPVADSTVSEVLTLFGA